MKKPLVAAATAMVGLMTAGLTVSLLALPADAGKADVAFKREQDTPDIVLVDEDDDDDDRTDDDVRVRAAADTNSRSRSSNSGNTRGDHSRTGARSGRDDSRSGRAVRDWTHDGPGKMKRDWSANKTNDRTRHNSRR